ncbi:substrate-binding periplasmic protein [Aestuariirhabdus litorea]|uniref:substrate-binding periplasmic protein n=1 Tax=Aestuariirhabdus litorea TaxID=2528527 RepID=UPI0013E3D77E|nr:transporter substrate-binding domain-containing protein [Aestuariirhabdus litorea]
MLLPLFSGIAAAAEHCREVRVSGHSNLPPLSWFTEEQMHGAGIVALRRILAKENIRVATIRSGSPQRLLKDLEDGRVDITLTATREPAIMGAVNLLAPALYTTNYLVMVRKDSGFMPDSWESLKRLRGVVSRDLDLGSEFEHYAARYLPLTRVQRAQQGLLMLEARRVEYAIYPLIHADLLVSLYNYEGTLRKAPVEIASNDFFIGVSKHIKCQLPVDKISAALEAMHDNAEIDQLANDALYQWMGLNL